MAKKGTQKSTSGGKQKAIVTADAYDWYEESENPETPRHSASKGDEIEVSAAEFKRGSAMHKESGFGLVKPRTDEAKDAKAAAEEEAAAEAAAAPPPPPPPPEE
jgi:hypothetical protein